MPKKPIEVVMEVLKPFMPIKKEIKTYPDPKIPEYMFKLVKDDELYKTFSADPLTGVKQAGIDPATIDITIFSEIARILRARLQGLDVPPALSPDTVTRKERDEGVYYNFDWSASWFWGKEGYNIIYDRGSQSRKSRNEMVGTNRNWSRAGVGNLADEVLRHEINLLFFPAQPLVTPELIEKIKEKLSTE